MNELSAMSVLDLLPDISERTWRRLTRRMAANQSPASKFETRVSRADGSSFVADVRLDQMGGKEPILFHAIIESPSVRRKEGWIGGWTRPYCGRSSIRRRLPLSPSKEMAASAVSALPPKNCSATAPRRRSVAT